MFQQQQQQYQRPYPEQSPTNILPSAEAVTNGIADTFNTFSNTIADTKNTVVLCTTVVQRVVILYAAKAKSLY
jgi:hypothetical protein